MTFSRTGSAGPPPSRRPSDQPRDPKTAPLPPVQDVVGERLRAVYSQILRDPVPQRFVELLDRLDGRTEDRA
jgi:Anti-sigma factor NepR